MYWKVFVFLKCIFTSTIDFSLNLVPLYTTLSRATDGIAGGFQSDLTLKG